MVGVSWLHTVRIQFEKLYVLVGVKTGLQMRGVKLMLDRIAN